MVINETAKKIKSNFNTNTGDIKNKFSPLDWFKFVHEKSDVDFKADSLHHTLGLGANQAASGALVEKLKQDFLTGVLNGTDGINGTNGITVGNIAASGTYVGGALNNGSTNYVPVATGDTEFSPLIITTTTTFDEISVDAAVIGAGTFRLAVFQANGLKQRAGTLYGGSALVTNVSLGLRPASITLTCPPGLYWLACKVDSLGGELSGWASTVNYPMLGSTSAAVPYSRYTAVGVAVGGFSGTAPASIPTADAIGGPRVMLRVA